MERFCDLVTHLQESPDKELRKLERNWVGIIIHHTGTTGELPKDEAEWEKLNRGTVEWLSKKDEYYVSAHFQISRAGEIWQLVDPRTHVAYHAGKSSYYHPQFKQVIPGWNHYAIGIELIGDGNLGPFSEDQYYYLSELIKVLLLAFPSIDPRCITGHENISPQRKVDPGIYFDWRKLFMKVFGENP